jgi:hypothetical protein
MEEVTQFVKYCIAGCALSRVIHRIQSEKLFWKPWLVFEIVRHIRLSLSGPVYGLRQVQYMTPYNSHSLEPTDK